MKRFFTIIFLLFFASSSFSQKISSSLLWKISGNGLDTPSYVFGTIHLICAEDLDISQTLIDALDKSEVMIMELDLDDANLNTELQKYSFNENNKNLMEDLDQKDVELINKFLTDNFNTELAQIGIFRPMVLSSMISMKLLPCQKTASVELELVKMAAIKKMDIAGLESVKEQVSVFDSIPRSLQIKWLVEMIEDLDKSKKEFAELSKVYQEQDINKIYEYTTELPEYKKYENLFLTSRNKSWIPEIEEKIKSGPSFIAVGAGHLGSENGIIKLLENKGYELEAIYMK